MEPECCFGNCLAALSECKTCTVPNYNLWMNDGICDGFLNNQDCCFDFEDCVGLLSDTRTGRISNYYGDIQREYLKIQGTVVCIYMYILFKYIYIKIMYIDMHSII